MTETDLLVIGSGPGGAMTAALAAEAGRDVLIVEEGGAHSLDSAPSYSLAEMDQKYRNGGLNTTFGKTNITYVEGRCVGGGSEINAGLYHRPLAATLAAWRDSHRLEDFSPESMWPHFEAVEKEVGVSLFPQGPGPTSELLRRGARSMGWSTREISRFWRYGPETGALGRRQSMSETLIPRAKAAGARLMAGTRVLELVSRAGRATHAETSSGRIRFRDVFVCAGAVQTPLLLRRSGFRDHVGDTLQLHPMIRVTATFPEAFNDTSFGVPTEQVDEFKPSLTLGCSYSSVPHLSLWMGADVPDKRARLRDAGRTGIFYVAAVGTGRGKVRELPLLHEPFIRLPLTSEDLRLLGDGLQKLGALLFAAGAQEVSNPVDGEASFRRADQLGRPLPQGRMAVSTIHLFSSVPMGRATDSWGKLHGATNVWVNDASLFPASPAVNPQGTVLALARRNALAWLGRARGNG